MSDAAWWAQQPGGAPVRRFSGTTVRSEYVTMHDGTRIAVDVYLPRGLPPTERVPAILIQTPYFSSIEFRSAFAERLASKLANMGAGEYAADIAQYGYANVLMDLRGSGASFGRKVAPLNIDAVRDGAEVLDWIVEQPWSNGRVGATGISGPGLFAQWLTTAKHPALRAIAPRFTSFDMFASTHPGGMVPSRFFVDIGAAMQAMDSNRLPDIPESRLVRFLLRLMIKGVRPVDGDTDRQLLAAAVREHATNEQANEQMMNVVHRDDLLPEAAAALTLDDFTPSTFADEMEASGTAIYAWTGWFDGGFVRDMITLHSTVRTPGSRLVIGPWGHGGRWYSSPTVRTKRATDFDHVAEMVRFFDQHLRDDTSGTAEEPIHYFTMGEERWESAPHWPVPGAVPTSFYLARDATLGRDMPVEPDGADRYRVDFATTTGVHSRFGKHLTGGRYPVRYPKRAKRDRKLLTYTSLPLPEPLTVTGDPVATLFVSSTATDGAFFVYLEDVDPDGAVRVVSDGMLRASARRTADAPYPLPVPYHPFRRDDDVPLTPGVVHELTFGCFPVSWVFGAGHRIRVAFAGADRDNFAAVGADQSPVITLHRSPIHASRIDLPVRS